MHTDRQGPVLLIQRKYIQPLELAGGGNWGRWQEFFFHVYLGSFSLALAQPQFASTDPGRWCLIKSSASKRSGQVWKLCSEWVWTAPLQPLLGCGRSFCLMKCKVWRGLGLGDGLWEGMFSCHELLLPFRTICHLAQGELFQGASVTVLSILKSFYRASAFC